MVFISGGSWLEFSTADDTSRAPNKTVPFHSISISQSSVCEWVTQMFGDFTHPSLSGAEWKGAVVQAGGKQSGCR